MPESMFLMTSLYFVFLLDYSGVYRRDPTKVLDILFIAVSNIITNLRLKLVVRIIPILHGLSKEILSGSYI